MFGHSISDAAGIEVEPQVIGFLVALVEALRPRYVIETGCYHGTTSAAIGQALLVGSLDTMDIDERSVGLAREACAGLPVTVHWGDSLTFVPTQPIDFAFLDSDPYIRLRELEHFAPYLAPDAVVAIHDSRDLPQPKEGWRWVNLPTPRGLLLVQAD